MKKYAIGVIGFGRIARIHIENLLQIPRADLRVVADPYADTALLDEYGIEQLYEEPKALFEDPDIDAVFICSPSEHHAEHIKQAAAEQKHIFCEKPLASTVEEIYECLDVIKETGVKFQLGFNRRFDPNFERVSQIVKGGRIGDPHLLEITSRDPEPPPRKYLEKSGGLFMDKTIHDFDMARFLMGDEVVEVFAQGAALVEPDIAPEIDTAVISLKFASGALGVINNSRKAAYGYDQRVEVFGSEGSIAAENRAPTNTILATESGLLSEKPYYFFQDRYQEAYRKEVDMFIDYLDGTINSPVNGNDGLAAVYLAMAAKTSYETGKSVAVDMNRYVGVDI